MDVGLVYKKGKFSAIEEAQLKDAIENYRIVSSPFPPTPLTHSYFHFER